jgi:very-short-patch-repair endonuclease
MEAFMNFRKNKEYDIGRSEMLGDFGITVIRFSDFQIMHDLPYVIRSIETNVMQIMDEL